MHDDDVGHVVGQRVGVSERASGLCDGCGAQQLAATQRRDVVDDVVGEDLSESVELSLVAQMPVQVDQFVDEKSVVMHVLIVSDDAVPAKGFHRVLMRRRSGPQARRQAFRH